MGLSNRAYSMQGLRSRYSQMCTGEMQHLFDLWERIPTTYPCQAELR